MHLLQGCISQAYVSGVRHGAIQFGVFRLCPTLLVLIAESTCPESFRGEKRVARKSAENITHNRYFLPPFRGIEYTIQLVRLHGSGL